MEEFARARHVQVRGLAALVAEIAIGRGAAILACGGVLVFDEGVGSHGAVQAANPNAMLAVQLQKSIT
jgi:hypothetical protein